MKAGLKKKQAFTLVEIMVVIIIVGVAASLALVRYQKVMTQAREREAINQLKVIHSVSEIYYARANEYLPGSGDTAFLNSGLGMNLLGNLLLYYSYNRLTKDSYEVRAAYSTDNEVTVKFIVEMTQAPISTAAGSENPCCDSAGGECPTLPDC